MTQQWRYTVVVSSVPNDDISLRFVSPLLVWAGSEPTGTPCCGKTDCTSVLLPASWLTAASVLLSRYSSTQRRSLESAMLWPVLTSKSDPANMTEITSTILRLHHDNKNVIRNFLFLGFQPLAPGHEFHPSNPNVVCFLYNIWTGTWQYYPPQTTDIYGKSLKQENTKKK